MLTQNDLYENVHSGLLHKSTIRKYPICLSTSKQIKKIAVGKYNEKFFQNKKQKNEMPLLKTNMLNKEDRYYRVS